MIDFKPITLEQKAVYEPFLRDGKERGCEYSFANLYLWGQQKATVVHGHMVLFSKFHDRTLYPYPVGRGDKKAVLHALMEDARERGIPFRITGMCEESRQGLEEMYPGQFIFHGGRDSNDYVYQIDDLADLKGRKYHRKKNHYNRFCKNHPGYRVEPVNEDNIAQVKAMVEKWYENKKLNGADADFSLEEAALTKAFQVYQGLGLEGLVLLEEGEVLAVTFASQISEDTMDVHFEKAREDVDGAYTAMNCEFAKYIRDKYPKIRFFNREEDMGFEGLRKAKESYYPHHMVEKCWAEFQAEEGGKG